MQLWRWSSAYAVLPASTVNTLPVTLRPPSPSRYSTMRATSSVSGRRRRALRPAPQRAAAGDALAAIGTEIVRQLGVDETGRDRVHGDAELADLARERT